MIKFFIFIHLFKFGSIVVVIYFLVFFEKLVFYF
uniref:Uncharacterized protein n=1 Tax=Rhodomela confervoides TaxID=35163 RepID=A0A1Z1MAJ3_RHOCN|nr:hypothetical protein [Rhodomela confervoides]ARW62774.1 hypothetical protein [Rhodomela confervoides]